MKKVKCTNGHFFDADRFSTCPICGAASATAVPEREPEAVPPSVHTTPLLTPAGMDRPAAPGAGAAPAGNALPDAPNAAPRPAPGAFRTFQPVAADPRPDWEPPSKAEKPRPSEADFRSRAGRMPEDSAPRAEPKPPAASLSTAIEATASQSISALPKTVAYYEFDDVEPPVGWLVCLKGIYAGRAFPCKTGRNRVGRAPGMDVHLPEDPSISRDSHAIIIYEPKQRVFFLQSGRGDGLIYHNGSLLFDHAELHAYDKIELGSAEFLFLPLCGERFTWDEYLKKGMV